MASNDEEEEGLASRATGIEVIEFLGLKWQTLADMNAQVALFRKQEEMRIMRWRDSRIQMSRSIQRRHGSFWADWEALGNDPCLACQLDRDPYRERIRCYCGDGEELYADMETAASGQWYSNRKAYFKTGKSHHRRSLKFIWRYQVAN
ncbi:hypothetical protein BGZ68_003599 [Mortierella alpina]|nr:hypothetical protein BGZ68_003599 [Mortierella alpina]